MHKRLTLPRLSRLTSGGGTISGNGTSAGSWDSDCASEGRSGSYASYYTFTLAESADVTITAESSVDTYLYLREGEGRDGSVEAENDDHADESDCTAEFERTTDSCIVESLDAGTYTIEVTTYDAEEIGDFTLTVGGLPVVATPTLAPTITITFGDLNWSSVRLQTRIAQYIAEMGYGYSTSVESGTSGPLFQALSAGSIDVLMEVWLPAQEDDWEAALAEGTVSSPGNSLGADWQSAFVIPKYLQEQYPDLDSVDDLKEERYRSLFATDETDGKARLVSCPIGWQCETVNAKQIEGYGLSDHVHIVNPSNGETLNADLTEAYENEDPWLGFQWGINEPALLLDLVRLEEPAYSDECWSSTMACAYEDSTVLIAVKAGLTESASDFVGVLEEWDFNVDGVYKPVFRWQADNPDTNTEDAAMWWLRGNNDVWSEWVTSDASAAIQDALDSGEVPEGWPEGPSITPEPTATPEPTVTPEPTMTPVPTPEPPADECVDTVSGNGTISGSWSSDCDSEGRSGSYASYYTFTLAESADVTITTESDLDTYLYLREGEGRDGSVEAENDDHADESDCAAALGSDTDSCITESLDAGTYTIEVTTYDSGTTGDFTLTVSGLPVAFTPTPEPTPDPLSDRAVLVALYNATGGDNWTDKENWLSDESLGEWQGVTTDDEGRVIELHLWENNLIGEIPTELGSLSEMTILELQSNQLTAEIPPELGNLSNLSVLHLWENDLSGEIPAELGNLSNLTVLDLPGNELSGEIPVELGNLSNLEFLSLSRNELSGEIPSELGNLSNLTKLELDNNKLTGTIPSELGNFANLKYLRLTQNQLSSEIPTELGNLTRLEELALGGNELDGEIPSELGNLADLTGLYLWGNELSGEIPSELGNLSSLEWLYLGYNQLSGEIPTELGNLSSLTVLELPRNELTGEIPATLGNLSSLTELYLNENQLTGELPEEFGSLSSLTVLDLGGNQLSGEIPSELGNLSNLKELSLWTSGTGGLSGEIPAELGSLSNLTFLNLTRNELSGEIPGSLGQLDDLELLALGGNQLSGEIPSELGSLSSLTQLYLWENQLIGDVPSELLAIPGLRIMALHGNQLSGGVPEHADEKAILTTLYNSTGSTGWEKNDNWASTETVFTWAQVAIDNSGRVTALWLGENQLSGVIPAELGNLTNLRRLYLNDNELTGEIPSELGNLVNLEALYLAGNQLSGCVPGELRDVQHNDFDDLDLPFCDETTTPEPEDECVSAVSGDGAVSGSWSSDCDSENKSGSYAHYYTFTLSEASEVTITLESSVDTVLYLLSGIGKDGAQVAENDDHADESDCADVPEGDTDSCITESLDEGSYTIEATTYDEGETGEFTLTVSGLPAAVAPEPFPDRTVLVALYNATDGDNWTDKENWLSDEPLGEWQGVTTDDEGRVTQLHLWENNLVGTIPAELGQLSSLTSLELQINKLSGSIPAELGNLSNLTVLYLWENQLSGEIPPELSSLSNLQRLSLSNNQLSDDIPAGLGDLSNLTRLYLNENQLSGEIPSELGNLSSLEILDLGDNQLSGGIPPELSNFSKLTLLSLTRNEVSGAIPDELGQLNNLEILALGGNQLSGEIPEELGNLSNLAELWAWSNQLSGEIPEELGNLSSLREMSLAGNQLTGEIPAQIGNLSKAVLLSLSRNRLSGEIPSELGGLANLDQLYLYNNQLSGDVPSELLAISGLRIMALYGNQLSGDVPEHTEEKAILTTLYNSTAGTEWNENENWGSAEPVFTWSRVIIDTSGHVTALWLHENQLSGEIPSELGSLTNLARLFLFDNQLTGEIPSELSNLEKLEHLFLAGNQLSGCIPAELQNLPENDFDDLGLEFCSE